MFFLYTRISYMIYVQLKISCTLPLGKFRFFMYYFKLIKEYIRASILKFILQNKLFLSPNLARYHWKYWNQKTCSVGTNLIYVSLISSCRFYKFLAQLKILNKYKIIIYNDSDVFLA